uniref:Trichoplein keratin filament-binding protein n=1 Tax=Paramormyrops kingsleyae TaxID=1676925 RepID=A0A3B3QWT9_9TELE
MANSVDFLTYLLLMLNQIKFMVIYYYYCYLYNSNKMTFVSKQITQRALNIVSRGPRMRLKSSSLTLGVPADCQHGSVSAGQYKTGKDTQPGAAAGTAARTAAERAGPTGGRAAGAGSRPRGAGQAAAAEDRGAPLSQGRAAEDGGHLDTPQKHWQLEYRGEGDHMSLLVSPLQLAQKLLQEHWKHNNPELRKMESALHQDHVVSQWKVQQSEKKKREDASREEERRFENERERNQQEALERMREDEEGRKAQARQRAEELRQQMKELKLREDEANRLKKEQEALLSQRWEVERLEEERKKQEESRRKYELRCFLSRQYRAQLKRRAQQVQEELEDDRRILAALLEGEEEDRRLASARRERAVADAAWMQEVLEEQLQLEQEREAEFDILHRFVGLTGSGGHLDRCIHCDDDDDDDVYREEAQRVWAMREAEWEKERRARERLMQEVLTGRRQQLDQKMLENRWAQEESLRRREELIEQLEKEKEARCQEREQEKEQRTARMREIDTQVLGTTTWGCCFFTLLPRPGVGNLIRKGPVCM